MSFRVSALVAVAGVLVLAEVSPARAQPQVPVRPRYSSFQNIFRPGVPPLVQPGPGFLGAQQPIGNAAGPLAPGFVYPGLGMQPQGAAGSGEAPPPPTGVVGTFNNLGHWYPNGVTGGNYGHWYPNGVANGRGILGYGGGSGGTTVGGTGRPIGSVLGTGMAAGATINQFRR